MRHLLLAAALAASAAPALAATHAVGPTRTYTTLQSLLDTVTLRPGDLVEVDRADYAGGVIVRSQHSGTAAQPVVIRGLRGGGRRPLFSGGTNTIELRNANHIVLEGFEFTGGTSRCVYVYAANTVLRDLLVRDCPSHGILSSDQLSGSLTLEYSEIRTSGAGDGRHALYIQTDEVAFPGSVFRMRHNFVHSGTGGNLLKSRAERNVIHYNWFEGAYYHELELIGPDRNTQQAGWTVDLAREDSEVLGNVIVHSGTFGAILRLGGDGTGESKGRYRLVNNTILATGSASSYTALRLFEPLESVESHNNVFHRTTAGTLNIERNTEAIWTFGRRVAGSNNWIRNGAGVVPAEWTGTLTGSDPGFTNLAGFDLVPAAGSPLAGAGNANPASPTAWPFPSPTPLPLAMPPVRAGIVPGTPVPRPAEPAPTIGAYARPATDLVFRSGFDP
ncbi:hypothetical protein ACQQ2N_19205 [Dokdonella sp. MW10]|uniref:hypothetical protein n=1 Tax=Dokdonella sp. MW10 TaxID=2992926 RepID=UPI003F7EC335